MVINFFEHQEQARRHTSLLIFLFTVAVVAIGFAVYAVVFAVLLNREHNTFFQPELFAPVFAGVLGVIAVGTLYKVMMLSGGGATVAEMLGGALVPQASTDRFERRLLNVVSEMAIASGVAVPPVYVLRGEDGINAFAAGFTPSDAVIAVSEGCMKYLNRDELQGVVAHEFSHIFNGDMRLNVRLMGVLNGILIIGLTGYWILRAGGGRSSSSRKGNGGGILLLGLGLFVIGYVGVFFANLIKAAVSREREYLADASAVQFTRNPSGIGGALKKIFAAAGGSYIEASRAQEASHFFFADGVRRSFSGLFSTHPPLDQRIRRIDPGFTEASLPEVTCSEPSEGEAAVANLSSFSRAAQMKPAAIGEQMFQPSPDHIAYAQSLIASLSPGLLDRTKDAYSARAVIYALLVQEESESHSLALVAEREGDLLRDLVRTLLPEVARLGAKTKLPLAELSLPALRSMAKSQYQTFKNTMSALVREDEVVTLFEYALFTVVVKHLDDQFAPLKNRTVKYTALDQVLSTAMVLVSSLAYIGNHDSEKAERACLSGYERLERGLGRRFAAPADPQALLGKVEGALRTLSEASSPVRLAVIEACVACVTEDSEVTEEEGELIRAIAAALECPLPPLVTER